VWNPRLELASGLPVVAAFQLLNEIELEEDLELRQLAANISDVHGGWVLASVLTAQAYSYLSNWSMFHVFGYGHSQISINDTLLTPAAGACFE